MGKLVRLADVPREEGAEQPTWIAEDFEVMRQALTEIETRLTASNIDPIIQSEFYKPIQQMILYALEDAGNPNDSFLYRKKE